MRQARVNLIRSQSVMGNFERLMVIITDKLSEIAQKGELTDRYYNPGNLFSEVHLVSINSDSVDPTVLQKLVGKANLVLHNIAPASLVTTLCWNPILLKRWSKAGIKLDPTPKTRPAHTLGFRRLLMNVPPNHRSQSIFRQAVDLPL
jgi:hypothetical protein